MSGSMAVDRSLTDEGRFAHSNFVDLGGHNTNRGILAAGVSINIQHGLALFE
jgi:hypothetical protein